MGLLEVKLIPNFTFLHCGERRMRTLWSVSFLLFIALCHSGGVQARRIDTLAQAYVIQAQPDSSSVEMRLSPDSSSFRRNLLQKKENLNQHNQNDYYGGEGRGPGANNDDRYSYFHNDEDDDQPLSSFTKPDDLRKRLYSFNTPSSPKSKFRTALLSRNARRQPSIMSKKQSSQPAFRKHTLSFGGDDSAEENGFSHISSHYDDEEDPHLHQERYKSSSSSHNHRAEAVAPLTDNEDDEASPELGRYSLVNSYFDNEYSLKKLHEMECITPTKSKGYCSTFRACVPSLFTTTGELEAPALAELISFSIGYCTMDANIAGSSNVLMKRAGHRFAEVANRIICCPGDPPASGVPSAEESAEKFNDFLANKGPELGAFDEDDEKLSVADPSVVTSAESVIWTSKEKIPTPIKTIQTSVKVTTPSETIEPTEESETANSPGVVQDEPVLIEGGHVNQPHQSSPTDDSNETVETDFSSSQERPTIALGQLEQANENPAEIPIEAFIPPKQDGADLFPVVPPENFDAPISNSPAEEYPEKANDSDEDMHGPMPGQESETSTVISITSSTSSSVNDRRNSSFIQIQPDPVIGVNGKFTLENGVYVEKATSATPRPKPNPSHQTTIGETTVNIIKTEVPVDSNSVSFQKLPSKPFSSKIPSTSSAILDDESQSSSQNDEPEANDFPVETTTATAISSEQAATTHRQNDMWDDSNVDAIRDESELPSTSNPTLIDDESDKKTNKPVGDSGANGITEGVQSTFAPQHDESKFPGTYVTSTTTPNENSGESTIPQQETTSSLPVTSSGYLSPDVSVDSNNNILNDDSNTNEPPTTLKTSSSDESSTGMYDVNPTTSEYEIQYSDQRMQTTIPAGHYHQDNTDSTTSKSVPTEEVPMQTSQFDDSEVSEQDSFDSMKTTSFPRDQTTEGLLYPTTTRTKVGGEIGSTYTPAQSDESVTPDSPTVGTHQDSHDPSTVQPVNIEVTTFRPGNNYDDLSKEPAGKIPTNQKPQVEPMQLFLDTKPGSQKKPFLAEAVAETIPPVELPTTKVPPKGHEDDSMESERDVPYPESPNSWSIDQLHSQQDKLTTFTKPSLASGESQSHESNELHEGGVNDEDSHSMEHTKLTGSGEDSHGSSEEDKKGSSSSVEDPQSEQQHDDNSLEESGESVAPSDDQPTTSSPINQSNEVPTTTSLPYGPVDDETITTSPPPPPPRPQQTQRPPLGSETGGIQFKPPQDSSGEAPVPVGSQPQFQILSACATQDYYRSLETDSSKQYPFLATIVGGSRPFCSGSLITDRHILTAAHFLSNITVADVFHMRVHIGYRSGFGGQTEGPFAVRKVLKVIRHKSFSFEKLVNDVAILILDRPVRFNEDVHPVCLAHSPTLYSGGEAEAFETGWVEDPLMKKISPHHNYVDPHILKYFSFGSKNVTWTLQEASTKVKTNEECAANYAFLEKSGIVIRDSMVCAAPADVKACTFKGNSGAPLFLNNDGKPVQIGLVSWGIGCGHFPAVFTSAASFIPWIEKVVSRTS